MNMIEFCSSINTTNPFTSTLNPPALGPLHCLSLLFTLSLHSPALSRCGLGEGGLPGPVASSSCVLLPAFSVGLEIVVHPSAFFPKLRWQSPQRPGLGHAWPSLCIWPTSALFLWKLLPWLLGLAFPAFPVLRLPFLCPAPTAIVGVPRLWALAYSTS